MSNQGRRFQGVVLTPHRLADEFLKWCCCVESKRELDSKESARFAFAMHHKKYSKWCVDKGYATVNIA